MRTPLTLAFASLFVSAAVAQEAHQSAPLPEDRATGAATITTEDLKSWLTTLTSQEFAGRGTGTEGFRRAATFVKEHFQSLGLEPYGDTQKDGTRSYWQSLTWSATKPKPDETWLELKHGDKVVAKLVDGEGLAGRAGNDAEASGNVVLVNVVPGEEKRITEYGLKGKFVLLHMLPAKAEAKPVEGQGRRGGRRGGVAGIMAARNELSRAEVAGFVIVDDAQYAAAKNLEGSFTPGAATGVNPAERGRTRAPVTVYTDGKHLEAAFKAVGKDLAVLNGPEGMVALGTLMARLQVKTENGEAPAYNVVAVLPGSDPKLKDEFVVIGSHLDHLGRPDGTLRPGADDDGSGSSGVLAVSRAFAKNKVKPRRSILFVTFCGEEMGLLGSSFFARNPPIPLESIVSELQMDMIGRDEEESPEGNVGEKAEDNRNSLHLIGTKKMSMDLHNICMAANEKHAKFDLEWDEEGMFSRSDHANFARKGVPVAFFFTGLHHDYHQPTDTVDRINFPKLARVATYVYDIGFTLAQQDARPLIDPELWSKSRKGLGGPEKPAAPVRADKGGK